MTRPTTMVSFLSPGCDGRLPALRTGLALDPVGRPNLILGPVVGAAAAAAAAVVVFRL